MGVMPETQLRNRRNAHNTALIPDNEAAVKQAGELILDAITQFKPKPSISDSAKVFKDKLRLDPYNMELMRDLGYSYFEDNHFKQCESVMIRGWKRVGEFKDPYERHEFLVILSKASYYEKKMKQAYAVLQDIEEPLPDEADARQYEIYKCKVCCSNGEPGKGLAAFHNAIEGTNYEEATRLWAVSVMELNGAGLHEITKEEIARRADTEEERARLDSISAISLQMAKLRERTQSHRGQGFFARMDPVARMIFLVSVFCLVLAFIYVLHLLEQRSLRSMKWATKL